QQFSSSCFSGGCSASSESSSTSERPGVALRHAWFFLSTALHTNSRQPAQGVSMNSDIIQGSWKELKGKVREKWGRLTDDEVTEINGSREKLEGTVQRVYGKQRDEVKREVDEWAKSSHRRDAEGGGPCGCGH